MNNPLFHILAILSLTALCAHARTWTSADGTVLSNSYYGHKFRPSGYFWTDNTIFTVNKGEAEPAPSLPTSTAVTTFM